MSEFGTSPVPRPVYDICVRLVANRPTTFAERRHLTQWAGVIDIPKRGVIEFHRRLAARVVIHAATHGKADGVPDFLGGV